MVLIDQPPGYVHQRAAGMAGPHVQIERDPLVMGAGFQQASAHADHHAASHCPGHAPRVPDRHHPLAGLQAAQSPN